MAVITATISHLARLDLYKHAKPYKFAYDLAPGLGPSTNHSYEPRDVDIHNVQGSLHEFSLDVHGFAFSVWETGLSSADFDNEAVLQDKYLPEVLRYMETVSPPGCELHIMNHVRRKRGPDFPNTREKTAEGVLNPIITAHADYTENGAEVDLHGILQEHPHLRDRKFDIINVWRPTLGPNQHWPLALCDFRTVDRADVETNDVIHADHIGESVRLYANPQHRWHYLDNQTADQVILFRSVVMDDHSIPFGMHSSFARSDEDITASAHRESIEVRVGRFFA
ncbi:hypothetical protein F503_06849 [Ophiostoma piceae UAMH 11346]|uniref:Methyltransferase n=1 Tax=Ophiostoma piceae (strain UAMH 11346) TaxID=1262450 RepID=S3CR43_OPHP1|nr:hypothetical protein F503_06849 [Ophiostoma piceae UAMH 11346]